MSRSALAAFLVVSVFTAAPFPGASTYAAAPRAEPIVIKIGTAATELVLLVPENKHVYQVGYGPIGEVVLPRGTPQRELEAYSAYGNGQITEVALQATHADGNTSTDLVYTGHRSTPQADGNVVETRVDLQDAHYPLQVALCFRAYQRENIVEAWTEIQHREEKPVVLERYASSAPVFNSPTYHLTQFHGSYMREAHLAEEQLGPGIKIIDSKLGVRAHYYRNPSFILSFDGPAEEEEGRVVGGTLAWSGSFQFAFDVDWDNRLRAVCGVQPTGSEYQLEGGRVFRTPAMLWTFSNEGKGGMTRNFHRWARAYGIRDGDKPRPMLLNNWEATYTDFDEQKIVSLFDGARDLGVEIFLLDDGWFGNKHPRNNDRAGLGDWDVNVKKLPNGLGHLAAEAEKRGLKFGIWIEPEMVNPSSELYEKHPEWIITQPHRQPILGRNQQILDLTRPEVKEFVKKVMDDIFAPNPSIAYTKWDANRFVTQPGSSHLPPDKQQHLMVDYQWALYETMQHLAEKYPNVMAMVCAGGSGRVDYGSLKYFHSFWPSDNTDPAERVFIQWGFSHFFPAASMSAHVTHMGERQPKFAVDVALSGAFGVDRDVGKMSPEERRAIENGIKLYRDRLRPIVMQGDLYRLQSPYDAPQAALSYVLEDRSQAVVFIYRLGEEAFPAVKPRGLDPKKRYRVSEINLRETWNEERQQWSTANSRLGGMNNSVIDGATLMAHGFSAPLRRGGTSAVIEIVEEK